MVQEFDILLFDIKDFSKIPSIHQGEIRTAIQSTINSFFKKKRIQFESVSTGDGYYICLQSTPQNAIILLDLIAELISENDNIEIRFSLHSGNLEEIPELHKKKSFTGAALNDLNRFLTGIKAGNVILASRYFYEKFVHGVFISRKAIGHDKVVFTYKKVTIIDKHNKSHELFNISYIKGEMEYGFEFSELESGIGEIDNLEFEDFRKIVEFSYGRKKASVLAKFENSRPAIHYCYLMLNISQYTKEYFLFIKNNSVKTQTLDHLLKNTKLSEPLTICANNKYLDSKSDDFWKNDLLQKFSKKAPQIKKLSFQYLDDFIWDNCIPDTMKEPLLFDEESNYINPEYEAEGKESSKDMLVEQYFWKFITNDFMPIALIKGPGGMGKTTLLKRLSDSLSGDRNYQKLVFYIDGQSLAKHLYRNEELHLEKIETLAGLLRFYFSTISSSIPSLSADAPILLNEELVDIIVSSGNVVIMVDGLDEISGFLKESFSLNTFISDIVKINKILNHSKIIISTRDYYWENERKNIDPQLIDNFKIVTLKGFNEGMAEAYFKKKFKSDSGNKAKALQILKSLTRSKNIDAYYWPFLVYLVSDIVAKDGRVSDFVFEGNASQSKYLDPGIEFDYIIINFCLREIQRQNLDLDIDDFIDLFKEIIIEHHGEMLLTDFRDYVHTMMPSVANSTKGYEAYQTLLINPLLKEKNSKASISIDFIHYHLTSAFLSHFIKEDIHSHSIYRSFSRFYDGKEDLLKDVISRLRKKNVNEQCFVQFIKRIVNHLNHPEDGLSEKLILERTISTILYIAFRLFESRVNKGIQERTKLLIELFDNELSQIHIFGDFYTLDFSSLTIRNSTLKNYNNLFKSLSNAKTLFIDSKIEIKHKPSTSKVEGGSWNESNFDSSCIINSDFKVVLKSTKESATSNFYYIKKDLVTLLKRFQRSGRFIYQTEDHLDFSTSSKLKSAELIHELTHFRIIHKDPKRLTYNWSVTENEKDSVNQLLHNNHIDATFERIIDAIYAKYYKL